jgi:glycerate 2-kinase
MIIPAEKFTTSSLCNSVWGDKICQVLSATIHAADPRFLLKQNMYCVSETLHIQEEKFDLSNYERIFLVGAGKAIVPMAEAVFDVLGRSIVTGLVITKDGYVRNPSSLNDAGVKIIEGAHPIPAQRNVLATRRILSLSSNLKTKDLVLVLISGGGSSLLTKPSSGVSIKDIQDTTSLLLKSGASIGEINTVRKHLDEVKGGGLAARLFPATVITLVLSDVIGDRLDLIASGPTVADPSTFADAWAILSFYRLLDQVPNRVRSHISHGTGGSIPETIKPGNHCFDRVHNFIVGNNDQSVQAAARISGEAGFRAQILPSKLTGDSARMGQSLVEYVQSMVSLSVDHRQPACYITGGESTVNVRGKGKGGRNQELALGAVRTMAGPHPMVLVSLATDGGDGPTDAAGAVVTNHTLSRGLELGLDPLDYLKKNDSYSYFDRLDDLVRIGPTLTNVNDLVFIFTE